MQLGQVSGLSIAGMIFSLVISFGLPVILGVIVHKKTKARMAGFLVGCATFLVFATILEQMMHVAVFALAGKALENSIVLYALYGALAAAVFEEIGRFVSMKYFMKNYLTRENGLMYGVGHGGIEAILILGIGSVNNLINSSMINSGAMKEVLASVDASMQQSAYDGISALWTTPSYMFFLGGIERFMTVFFQIALSVFVYMAVKHHRKWYWGLAFGLHFLADFVVVLLAQKSSAAAEIYVLAITVLSVYLAARVYRMAGELEPGTAVKPEAKQPGLTERTQALLHKDEQNKE